VISRWLKVGECSYFVLPESSQESSNESSQSQACRADLGSAISGGSRRVQQTEQSNLQAF